MTTIFDKVSAQLLKQGFFPQNSSGDLWARDVSASEVEFAEIKTGGSVVKYRRLKADFFGSREPYCDL